MCTQTLTHPSSCTLRLTRTTLHTHHPYRLEYIIAYVHRFAQPTHACVCMHVCAHTHTLISHAHRHTVRTHPSLVHTDLHHCSCAHSHAYHSHTIYLHCHSCVRTCIVHICTRANMQTHLCKHAEDTHSHVYTLTSICLNAYTPSRDGFPIVHSYIRAAAFTLIVCPLLCTLQPSPSPLQCICTSCSAQLQWLRCPSEPL